MNFKAVLALPKTTRSSQTHKSISFIWIVWSTLYVYLWWTPTFKRVNWFHFVRVHATRNTNSIFQMRFQPNWNFWIYYHLICNFWFNIYLSKNWVDFWEYYRLSSSLKSTQRNFICKKLLHACEREIQSYQKWFKSFQSK